ncbi:MAG: hypothetical protein IPJ81_07365 [Chitinophagaceae bacterium]|nr:hypothetical protein [Chitinophagaceae bacterium]
MKKILSLAIVFCNTILFAQTPTGPADFTKQIGSIFKRKIRLHYKSTFW